jgi:hypothetical protein
VRNLLRWCRNEWERTVSVLAVVAGLVVFFLGWLGQRDKSLVTEQIPYVVSGAMFGLLLIVLGTTVWLSADMRDEWIKLDRVEETVARAVVLLESETPQAERAPAASYRPAGAEPVGRAPVEVQR